MDKGHFALFDGDDGSAVLLSEYRRTIRFDGSGLPDGQWGSFWLQTRGYTGTVRVVMNAVGRIRFV